MEESLEQVRTSVDSVRGQLQEITDAILRVDKNIAQVNYETEHLTDMIVALEESKKTSETLIDDLQTDLASVEKEVVVLRKFNDKVVLFYTEDEGLEL